MSCREHHYTHYSPNKHNENELEEQALEYCASIRMQRWSNVEEFDSWADKYAPRTLTQLVFQHAGKSARNKRMDWLKDWAK